MTEDKKKTEKKADDTTEKHDGKQLEKQQPISEDVSKENISEEIKEKSVDASEKEEKSDVETEDKPILDTSTDEDVAVPESEEKPMDEVPVEPQKESVEIEETTKEDTKIKEEQPKGKSGGKKGQDEPKKPVKKEQEKDEDFQYIVRIANTDIDGDKTLVMGIAQIKGIGRHMAVLIADATGIDKKIKMGKLTDTQIEKIKELLENIEDIAPGWMLNHRKDIDTGDDIHLISSEVELRLRDDVNLLKMIRSYRGIRHETGLSVRGQRTRANNRRGLALGVSKKRPGT